MALDSKVDFSISNSTPGDVASDKDASKADPRPWHTTFVRFGPLSGLFGMLLAVIALVISLGILAGSDGAPTSSWSAPPSTYLAICTAIANLSMRYAAIHGIVIAWWYRAMKGSTIEQMHSNWRSGTSLTGALTAGRRTGLMALACIFSTLVIIDGPLLQRASIVISAPIRDQTVDLTVSMAPQIPRDSTGGWSVMGNNTIDRWTYSFNETFPTWNGSAPNNIQALVSTEFDGTVAPRWFGDSQLSGMISECPGKCSAKIRAPAVSVSHCREITYPVNYSTPYSWTDVERWTLKGPPYYTFGFLIDVALVLDEQESINLITGYSQLNGHGCVGTFRLNTCSLRSAVGEYNVTIDHDVVTLSSEHPEIVGISNNAKVNHNWSDADQWRPSTLAGVISELYTEFNSFVIILEVGGEKPSPFTEGTAFESFTDYHPDQHCMPYKDPQEELVSGPPIAEAHAKFDEQQIKQINNLMFRTGAAAAKKDASWLEARLDPGMMEYVNTTISARLLGDHEIFHTEYRFFAIAIAVEVMCICLILPTYWGWWTFGRPVSFSPLEMAKAFESPTLANLNSNSSGRDIARELGRVHLQYGVITQDPEGQKLAFAPPEGVKSPESDIRLAS